MGATDPEKAEIGTQEKNTVFQLTTQVHGSDSMKTPRKKSIFFKINNNYKFFYSHSIGFMFFALDPIY